jgi:hypothetical protein
MGAHTFGRSGARRLRDRWPKICLTLVGHVRALTIRYVEQFTLQAATLSIRSAAAEGEQCG